MKELADSIDADGLVVPLVVQPYEGRYRIVCGHRRFTAVRLFLKWDTVPAIVQEGLTDRQARLLNLKENIEREDLSLYDEARAIANTFDPEESQRSIAKQLNRSQMWVSTRRAILELPGSIQNQIAAGYFTVQDCREIITADNPVTTADRLFRARKQGKKRGRPKGGRFKSRPGKDEVQTMIDKLIRLRLEGFPTRLLAWSAGWISDSEIDKDIKTIYNRRREKRKQ